MDDESAYHAIVVALLPWIGGVDFAGTGPEAVAAVRARPYDLVLVDIEMPGRDGYQVAADIRAAAEWARLAPVIAFTTLRPAAGVQHFIDRGFDGWLAKPFAAADLVALVRRWIGGDQPMIGADDRRSQLADLLGQEAADAMVGRMLASLAEAVEAIDAGGDERALGHRMGGLAGTLGFPALSAAWLALEDGGRTMWPTARAITQETIQRLGGRSRNDLSTN
ncbi:response regulator [Sphingomonas sp. SRS2]|uniref:response regulator n=1 Tax=Sphingomonas sp. SRS2 TaxID=133190 RepID=UPI001F303A19|nr:response regulator [Sphingomonas sp. SRS2]